MAEKKEKKTVPLESMGIHDRLSGLYNQRFFDHQLGLAVERAKRKLSPLCLLMFCFDHFEEYREMVGDSQEFNQVTVKLGEVVKSAIRRIDQAFRLEGEIFSIIVDSDLYQAKIIAKRIKDSLSQTAFLLKKPAGTPLLAYKTISVGIAELEFTKKHQDLLRNAHDAMFIAKCSGGDQINIHRSFLT
ncbi:MAG: GGDEF domain-containing protein [bacterium]